MTDDRGEVRWGPAPHKSGPPARPWVVVSGGSHPFSETECIVLAMTTQEHSNGVEVPDEAWIRGGSEKTSYISPWYVATFKQRDFRNREGVIEQDIVATAVEELHRYTAIQD